ncbi:MAG: T9SS type A sorting domain-containing protein [Vicingaceae bacterium]
MKTLTTLFILLLSTSISFAQITDNWTKLNSGTTENINDIYFQSPDTGYIVGDNYLFKKTTDGGQSWLDLTPPNIGERPGNNGNIIGIDLHPKFPLNNFSQIDSGLYLNWEQPFYGVVTADDGNSYTAFNYVDTNALCEASGFEVLPETGGNFYTNLITYGKSCNNVSTFTNYYDGPFAVGMIDSAFVNDPGSFTTVDADSFALILGHSNGNLLRYISPFSSPTSILLDTSGISTVGYAGDQTWFAAINKGLGNMYISTDTGMTFQIDTTFPQLFHFKPIISDFDFLPNGNGVASAANDASLNGGVIVHRDSAQWYFVGADHPLNAVQVFSNGTAYVAGDNGLIMKTTNTSIGMEETRNKAFVKLYPNPVNSTLNIEIEGNRKIESIELYDLNGRLVHRFPGNTKSIDFSTHPKGLYLIKLNSKGQEFSKKIVVE